MTNDNLIASSKFNSVHVTLRRAACHIQNKNACKKRIVQGDPWRKNIEQVRCFLEFSSLLCSYSVLGGNL